MEEFDVAGFEKKLAVLKDTQDSIQTMSTWCLSKRAHHKKIVSSWLSVLKQVKVEHRLTLFHLANDVIQYSKRKHYEFVESWGTTLQKATTMVRDEKVKHKILRIFKIWEQRGIYNEEFLSDLNGLLSINNNKVKQTENNNNTSSNNITQQISTSSSKHKRSKSSSSSSRSKHDTKAILSTSSSSANASSHDEDFQPQTLVQHIRDCVKLEVETDKNFKIVTKQIICEAELIKYPLKDRQHVESVEKDINDSLKNLHDYIKSLRNEINARSVLVIALDQAESFYHHQRGEVKVVANAYKNFGNRIKNMKKKLAELQVTLPSPMPSPDINAPSPEPDTDLILPGEDNSQVSFNIDQNYFLNQSTNGGIKNFGYMNSDHLPFDINDFGKDSPNSQNNFDTNQRPQPIQVINFRTNDLFKQNNATDENNYCVRQQQSQLIPPQPVPPVLQPPFIGQPNLMQNFQSNFMHQQQQQQQQQQQHCSSYNDTSFNQSLNNSGYMNSNNSTIAPLLPPPLPPTVLDHSDEYNQSWENDWNTSQSGFHQSIETPISPPHFERKGQNTDIREYAELADEMSTGAADVDHRQLNLSKEKIRSLDIDHRNLISLTGSPITKSDNEIPPPPEAPPLLWQGAGDTDFRLNHSSNMDPDYRVPPLHGFNFPSMPILNKQSKPIISGGQQMSSSTSLTNKILPPPPPPPPTIQLDSFHNINEYLMQDKRNSLLPMQQQQQQQQINNNKNLLMVGGNNKLMSPMKGLNSKLLKNGRGDNVESVDMEMSDEDNEDSMKQNLQQMRTSSDFNLLNNSSGGGGIVNNNLWLNNNGWMSSTSPPSLQQQQQNLQRSQQQPQPQFFQTQVRQFSPQMNNYRGGAIGLGGIGVNTGGNINNNFQIRNNRGGNNNNGTFYRMRGAGGTSGLGGRGNNNYRQHFRGSNNSQRGGGNGLW